MFNFFKKKLTKKTTNPKAPFQLNGYKIIWSKTNKTWQIWKGNYLVNDFATKEKARGFAEKQK